MATDPLGAFVFVTVLIVFVVICVVFERRRAAAFREQFPPISDAEFVARCRPGTNPEIALKVRRILADALNVEYERIYPTSRLTSDLRAE